MNVEIQHRNKIRIAPSILNADRNDLVSEMNRVAAHSDLIHLDIMDNIFVPNLTFDFEEGSALVQSSPIPVDTHLMVIEPELWGPRYAKVGSYSVTFHLEATSKISETIQSIHDEGALVGVALKPGTPWLEILPWIDEIDMALIMSVEPGFGGQKFMENMMEKVSFLRKELDDRHLDKISIEVDGGISSQTIAIARKAGADTFVAGSAVYKDENPGSIVDELRKLAANIKTDH